MIRISPRVFGIAMAVSSFAIAGNPVIDPYQKGDSQLGDGGSDLSDPINLSTGEYVLTQTDFHIPGRGLDFEIIRTHRSYAGLLIYDFQHPDWEMYDPDFEVPIGDHWDINYNMRLSFPEPEPLEPVIIEGPVPVDQLQPPAYIDVFPGTSRVDRYARYTTGVQNSVDYYSNPTSNYRVEVGLIDQPIYITDENKTVYKFFAGYPADPDDNVFAGRLESITDRNGNQIQFFWEEVGAYARIDYAIDTLGHHIEFYYHDQSFDNRTSVTATQTNGNFQSYERAQLIWAIEDHAGRAVEYNYTKTFGASSGILQLTSVILPAIEADTGGNFPLPTEHERFPNGREWKYTYDSEDDLVKWDELMLATIRSPNGDIVLENDYDVSPNDDRNDARVLRQVYGDGVFNYVVTTLAGSTNLPYNSDVNDDDYYVWVNDRRGAVTRLKYAGAANPNAMHRQLLERVEYEGFFDNKDASIFGTVNISTGDVTAWNILDTSDFDHDSTVLMSGPKLSDGTPTTDKYIHSWETSSTWNPRVCYAPGGDSSSPGDRVEYVRIDDGNSDDPRAWGSVTSRTEYSVSYNPGSITEQWAYNFDTTGDGGWGAGFETGYMDGNGNVTIKKYDTAIDPITGRANGNLLAEYRGLTNPDINANADLLGVANTSAIDVYTYNEWGQVLTHTHPATTILNASGVEESHNRVDQFEYYDNPSDEANHGRLFKKHIDVNGFNLTTIYEYDLIGNVIKETHPDGDVTEYLYNQDSQLVREQRFDDGVTNNRVLYAQIDLFYDAMGYLVREEVLNLSGEPPVVQANQIITTIHEYDMHGYRTVTSREHGDFSGVIDEEDALSRKFEAPIGDPNFASEQWVFDEAKNLKSYHYGQSLNGADPQASNVVVYEYDARDMLIRKTQGSGSAVGDTLVTTAQYDDRGRPSEIYVNEGGVDHEQHYTVQFDGFNRVAHYFDPMGNQTHFEYDDNDNVVESYLTGPVGFDLTNAAENSYTLSSQSYSYDALDRLTLHALDIFDYDYGTQSGPVSGPGPHGIEQQETAYQYNRDSTVYSISESSGDAATDRTIKHFFDTASRLGSMEDNDLNMTAFGYDAASNIDWIARSEQSTLIGGTSETFIINRVFDSLDRMTHETDGAGNLTIRVFDSRSNMVEQVDPRGNITRTIYDGMSRPTETQVVMNDTGDGTGVEIGQIINKKEYDDSNRVVAEIDDAGNRTEYEHDGLNRLIKTTMPDGAMYETTYDDNGNMAVHTDARGLVISHEYDRNNRLAKRLVDGIEIESYLYDGMSRVRQAKNDFAKVTREYDSRSNVTREIQNVDTDSGFDSLHDQVVGYSFDTASNTSQIMYPGGRVINRSYDHLNRLISIDDPSLLNPITEFGYVGDRVKRRTHGNDTRTGYEYNGINGGLVHVDDHGFGRVSKITTSKIGSGVILDAFDFRWDENQIRSSYQDSGSGMDNRREREFGYDSSDRLVSSSVDYPSSLTTKTDDTTTYSLDDDHNRTDVTELIPSGEGDAGAGLGLYELNGNQALNNQYSVTPREDGSEWAYQYDANGNMILMGLNIAADLTGDYSLDFADISSFLTAFGNEDPLADFNGDGEFDFLDTQAFLQEYSSYPTGGFANRRYTYDFRNQLTSVEFRTGLTVDSSVVNTYDPFARRVTETAIDSFGTESGRQMVYGCESLWEVIEQIDLTSEQTLTTHVFGIGIDDEVGYRVESASAPIRDIWTHRDDLGSLTSITDSNGDVLERYEYGDYGLVTIMDADGVVRLSTMHSAFHLYTGRSLIAGTGLYDYRYRVMDPVVGGFLQRDPLGHIDTMNIYVYVGLSPFSTTDPFGLYPGYNSGLPGNRIANALGRSVGIRLTLFIANEAANNSARSNYNNPPYTEGMVQLLVNDPSSGWIGPVPDSETKFHRYGKGNENNQKYINTITGEEGVYKDGYLVKDGINDGTFNYGKKPKSWKHVRRDILPWMIFGI